MDFETRSVADLKEVGAWLYSVHPTTEVMCMAYKLPGDESPRLWHMAHPHLGIEESPRPEALFRWLEAGGFVEAHNAAFEWYVWQNVCAPRMGWPELPLEQLMCSAAKASVHALPRALEDAAAALGLLEQKDMVGHKSMRRLSKGRLADDGTVVWYEGTRAEVEACWEYCRQDVRTEEELSESLPDLSDYERRVWMMDLRLNRRGVRVDRELAESAVRVAEAETARFNGELRRLTGVERATQRKQVSDWLAAHEGIRLPDTKAETLDRVLGARELSPRARRVLTILRGGGKTAAKKYAKALAMMDDEDRVRDIMMYHGAERTGRWAGKGIQVHNFKRGAVKDIEAVCRDIVEEVGYSPGWLRAYYGDVVGLLGDAARGLVVADPGRLLAVADYAAIEARVLFWLVRNEQALRLFAEGGDIYLDMASDIYKRPCTKEDKVERFVGKQSILGLGYGMGPPKFADTCAKYGQQIKLGFARRVVRTYRQKYPQVVKFWGQLQEAAVAAVKEPGSKCQVDRVAYEVVDYGDFLRCTLPSGRPLHYFQPRLEPQVLFFFKAVPVDPKEAAEGDGEESVLVAMDRRFASVSRARTEAATRARRQGLRLLDKEPSDKVVDKLTYATVDDKAGGLVRTDTYGGKLCENVDQATARDLLADAMLRVDGDPRYDLLMTVHDEVVAQARPEDLDLDEFCGLVSQTPRWAEGCPVGVDAWIGPRYKKG